ncbi:MarR family winged helix-turn-helix transcriptional regulator [Streptomyces sulphureus]|uniref:MarR family winged helix-turn-helix transcriptional regulator n=1 Tax=Streptomyces sulphureus TaxID=47758 RepID=UPI001FE21BE2|nr:MarR family transcriptional regulator [Streptomyces sulphureus]
METKTDAVGRIERLLAQVAGRFTAEDDAEQQWLIDQCSPEAARLVPQLSVQALHLLDAVPADGSINVVGLSRATDVPKGTVSKHVRRLVVAGALERHRLPDNLKEVHLRLAPVGAEIQQAHRSLHAQTEEGLRAFLHRYSEADLAVLARVLTDLARMPREGLRFRPDLLD